MLSLSNVYYDLIPLAKIDTNLIEETVSGYAAFKDIENTLASKLTNERDIYIRQTNSIENLNKELKELKEFSGTNNYRTAEIEQMIIELTEQRNNIEANIRKI